MSAPALSGRPPWAARFLPEACTQRRRTSSQRRANKRGDYAWRCSFESLVARHQANEIKGLSKTPLIAKSARHPTDFISVLDWLYVKPAPDPTWGTPRP